MHLADTCIVKPLQPPSHLCEIIRSNDRDYMERLLAPNKCLQRSYNHRGTSCAMRVATVAIVQLGSSIEADCHIDILRHHDAPRLAGYDCPVGRHIKPNPLSQIAAARSR